MSLLQNLKLRGLRDILRPRKWKIFARYAILKAWKKEYPELHVPEYVEQIATRMSNPGCRPCVEAGACVHCGCKSPELFFDKDNECSGANWFQMIPPAIWNIKKQLGEVKVDDFYVKQIQEQGKITQWRN